MSQLILCSDSVRTNYSAFVNTVMNLNDRTALVRADFRITLPKPKPGPFLSHYVGESGEFRFAFEVPPFPELMVLRMVSRSGLQPIPQIAVQMSF